MYGHQSKWIGEDNYFVFDEQVWKEPLLSQIFEQIVRGLQLNRVSKFIFCPAYNSILEQTEGQDICF